MRLDKAIELLTAIRNEHNDLLQVEVNGYEIEGIKYLYDRIQIISLSLVAIKEQKDFLEEEE